MGDARDELEALLRSAEVDEEAYERADEDALLELEYQRVIREAERGGSMQAVPKPDTTPKPAAAPPRMSLAKVVSGRIAKPVRVLVWGTEGIGKSTFGANAPAPIFLGAEDGTSELDVARFPEPTSWQDGFDAVAELTNAEHTYKTLVVDTLDWLEPMCWAHVCATKLTASGKRATDIEGYGYGKGYNAALEQWRRLLAMMERLRNLRGMNVVLLAHGWIKPFKNPDGDDFDRYELKLHPKAGGLLKEWCDAVLFANYETLTAEANGRAKGISTGARVLHTQRRAAWDAKNRYDLPETLPLDWHTFAEAVAAHRPADPAQLKARIAALLERAPDDIRTRVTAALERVGDNAAELARIADKLAAQIQIQEKGQS